MDSADTEYWKSRVHQWKVASEVLDRERALWLRTLSQAEAWRVIEELFGNASFPHAPRPSGLVELQRYLSKLK